MPNFARIQKDNGDFEIMIVSIVLALVGVIFNALMNLFGTIPAFSSGMLASAYNLIDTIIQTSSAFVFFMIRPATFFAALDILVFLHFAEPIYHFVMWLLRKLPFLGIK